MAIQQKTDLTGKKIINTLIAFDEIRLLLENHK
jgi:hypothetical protein